MTKRTLVPEEIPMPIDDDVLYLRVCEWAVSKQTASIIRMQLHFKIGIYQALRMIDRMMDNGVIPPPPNKLN